MNNLSLNKKMIVLVSIFAIASIVIAYFGVSGVIKINEEMSNLVNVTNKRLIYAKDMDSLINQIKNREKVYILEDDVPGMKTQGEILDSLEKKLSDKIDAFELIATEMGKKDLMKLEDVLKEWKKVSLELREFALAGKNDEAEALARGKSLETLESFGKILETLIERNEKFMTDEVQYAENLVHSTRNTILVVSVVALLVGCMLATIIMKMIGRAIDQVITNLNDSSNQVASASSQIASSSEELSQATTEQAASLEQTASSVEEMSKMINRNSDNARSASENSQYSQKSAMKGKETVNEMIRSIDEINDSNNKIMDQINHSNEQMGELVKVIMEIGNKTKVINDIVFQTKLLSFNASVEAARAGEHGKGFAVVAEEVGNLAAMSGNAAKEISTMLDDSIRKVETTVNETKTSVDRLVADGKVKVENGIKVANECGNVLEEIVVSIAKVNSMAEEIATASVEQAQGISEITKAMHLLDQVTQQNAAASEEAASSAEELSAQADVLKSAVGVLVTTIKGGQQNTVVSPSAVAPTMASVRTNVLPLSRPAPKKKPEAQKVDMNSQERAPAYDDARFKDV